MSETSAKERRAKQTINNLLLSLLATAGLVLLIFLVVPRDETDRIPHIDYQAIAAQATQSSGHNVIVPDLPKSWWSNHAQWSGKPVDAVPRFEAGFVGPRNEYIGYIHAFGVNPTWLALETKDVVLLKTSGNWEIYRSAEVHTPAKTRDYIWIEKVGNDAFEIFGTANDSQFKEFAKTLDSKVVR